MFKRDLWQGEPYVLLLYQVTNAISLLSSLRLHVVVVFLKEQELYHKGLTESMKISEKLLANRSNLDGRGKHPVP